MLGYVCKYTPMELFTAMDTDIKRLEPSVTDFNHADTLMHANICSYTKAVLEDVMENDYEGVILTTCCDSIRRLYDTLKLHWKKPKKRKRTPVRQKRSPMQKLLP